ncbi:MAG: UDP-glucose 4-epimerase GalE [Patescibacteria group bacterium]
MKDNNALKIIVTGGAGYIGSFFVKSAINKGYEVVIIDSSSIEQHKNPMDSRAGFINGDLKDKKFVDQVFVEHKPNFVVHFAGYISMTESMSKPHIYFENNVNTSLNILESMAKHGVNNLIFSSSAGVYGDPIETPIKEDHPKNPTNPYGESKLIIEKMIAWYRKIYGLNFVCLRYFNACGASMDGKMGEEHSPETHIIPNAINALLSKTEFSLHGDDYDTKDGTCVRDYIHVLDLVEAHMLAISKLKNGGGGFFYNVGTGEGTSNKEVINMIEKVSGLKINLETQKRRHGDASALVADPTLIKKDLGFEPKYSDLETIIKSAWEWHKINKS